MRFIIEIPLYTPDEVIFPFATKTIPFEFATLVGLKAALKVNAEKVASLGKNATYDDYFFRSAGFEINVHSLIVDGVYEEPNIFTVNEYFKSYQKTP